MYTFFRICSFGMFEFQRKTDFVERDDFEMRCYLEFLKWSFSYSFFFINDVNKPISWKYLQENSRISRINSSHCHSSMAKQV